MEQRIWRKGIRWAQAMACGLGAVLLLSACVAQQADVVRMKRELQRQIARLAQEKAALAKALETARKESKRILETQRREIQAQLEDLRQARAQLNSELRSLREENLTELRGELETEAHRLDQVEQHVGDLSLHVEGLSQELEARDRQRAEALAALESNLKGLIARVESKIQGQGQTVQAGMAEFQRSLEEFRKALNAVRDELGREQQRAKVAETGLQDDLKGRQQAFQKKMEADLQSLRTYLDQEVKKKVETDLQALRSYLEQDIKPSIESVATTVEQVNAELSARLDTQRESMDQMQAALETKVQHLQAQIDEDRKQLETFTTSLGQVRDVLTQAADTLGQRVDEQGNQLAELEARLTQLDGHVTQLAAQYEDLSHKLTADLQALQTYLDQDVRTSLAALAKALEDEKQRSLQQEAAVDTRIQHIEQQVESRLAGFHHDLEEAQARVDALNQTVVRLQGALDSATTLLSQQSDEQVQRVGQIQAQVSHVEEDLQRLEQHVQRDGQATAAHLEKVTTTLQTLAEGLAQAKKAMQGTMKDYGQQMAAVQQRVAKLERQQDVLAGKIDRDTQTVEGHLHEVNTSVQSTVQAVKHLQQELTARLNAQAKRVEAHQKRLNEIEAQVQTVPALQRQLATAVEQFNELTRSLAELKGVMEEMGTKLGARVD
ncbi:MAG: hypothetical protein D6704_08500, partial [Nitrospirae bacterium]